MIFKWNNECKATTDESSAAQKIFSFDELWDELLYEGHKPKAMLIEKEESYRFFTDQIASFYRRLFAKGYSHRQFLTSTFLMTRHFLERRQYEFICYIGPKTAKERNGESPGLKAALMSNDRNSYYSEWKSIDGSNDGTFSNPVATANVFPSYKPDTLNIFFVFGCQNIAMLDSRVHTAAMVLADLTIKTPVEDRKNNLVVLSGWNNSDGANAKVQFPNESLMMKNLILSKINYFLSIYAEPPDKLPEPFATQQIFTEIESRNTEANILGLFNMLKEIYKHNNPTGKHVNLFLISSSSHLLEITEKLNNQLIKGLPENHEDRFSPVSRLGKKLDAKSFDLYLIGTDHPQFIFTAEQEHEVKLLVNHTLYNSFIQSKKYNEFKKRQK